MRYDRVKLFELKIIISSPASPYIVVSGVNALGNILQVGGKTEGWDIYQY